MSSLRLPIDTEPEPISYSQKLMKIQQKLQSITVQRHNQIKDEAQESITKRVLHLQVRTNEEIKEMQSKMRSLREELCHLKVREAEQSKKYQLNRKTRAIGIAQLQKTVMASLSFESQERKEHQLLIIRNLQDKTNLTARDIHEVQRRRIIDINQMEENLARQLPTTNLAIQSGCSDIQSKLERQYKEVRANVQTFKEDLQKQQNNQEEGFKNVMKMISNVVDEAKRDIQEERRLHQQNKAKLLSLFESATQKLTYSQ